MKKLKLGLCFLDENDNIFVKRFLNVNWELNLEQDRGLLHNVHHKDELAQIMTDQIKIDLGKGIVKDMLTEIGEMEKE